MTTAGPGWLPLDDRTRRQRLSTPLVTAGVLAAGVLALRLRDPHVSGSWGFCPSRVLFGISCPGCGGLRAVNDLTHGDVLGAASSNLLLVAAVPVVAWVFVAWFRRAWLGRTGTPGWLESPTFYVVWVAVMAVFTVARNTPAGAWLAP